MPRLLLQQRDGDGRGIGGENAPLGDHAFELLEEAALSGRSSGTHSNAMSAGAGAAHVEEVRESFDGLGKEAFLPGFGIPVVGSDAPKATGRAGGMAAGGDPVSFSLGASWAIG
jgi:hypothetical protein